ncbi:MAG: hypothetical protein ONB23_13075 [candidate division KSB1 bacterium]|nr:hypothetical protein [candidate division KSB1 bacterium]
MTRARSDLLGVLLLLGIAGCSPDVGIKPLPGVVRGKIIFRGQRPADTQGVYLIVAPHFPPHAINELYHSPNSVNTFRDTVAYEMELPYGRYEAIGLWWYGTKTRSNLADILALPLDPFREFRPLGFELTPEKPVFEVNLYANWAVVDRDAAIEGTIYFDGPYPPNTEATAVAAYAEVPRNSSDYIVFLRSLDFSVAGNPFRYRLPVRHGTYKYVVVFWLGKRMPLTDFRTLGFYENPAQPGVPGRVVVGPGQTAKGIDIRARWENARP